MEILNRTIDNSPIIALADHRAVADGGQSEFQQQLLVQKKMLLNTDATAANSVQESKAPRVVPDWLNRLWSTDASQHKEINTGQQQFVNRISAAVKWAADKLKTEPEAIMAIAAHESGWGHRLGTDETGQSSNNLFGIKAHGWPEERVLYSRTTEYLTENPSTHIEPFRRYPSWSESIMDFAAFLSVNPRYSDAVGKNLDGEQFISEIHRAGYATDPAYTEKVISVLQTVRKLHASSLVPGVYR